MQHTQYNESMRYRCLNENFPHLSEELYLTMCGIEHCSPEKEQIARSRDGYHLHIIMAGEGTLETENASVPLRAGQMFLLKPSEYLAYQPNHEHPWTYCWMTFGGYRAEEYMLSAGFTQGVNILDCFVEPARFAKLCNQLLDERELNTASALKRMSYLLCFLSLAVESREHGEDLSHRQTSEQKQDYVQRAMDYMQNNYTDATVTGVAKYLNIDRSYLSACFRKGPGISPSEYLLQIRMRESARILHNRQMSIQEVSRHVGYEDPMTFSKAFKRFFGISPMGYREMSTEEQDALERVFEERKEEQKKRHAETSSAAPALSDQDPS